MSGNLDLGSMNDVLAKNCGAENLLRSVDEDYRTFNAKVKDGGDPIAAAPSGGVTCNLMRSSGPISDAYILGSDPVMLITGPGGSGKTTASVKKALVEAQRIRPGADGVRRYVLGVWRQKYVNLWKATIPSWWTILPKDLPGSKWNGAPPRDATHIVRFEDQWGPVELISHFRAFGDVADPQDLKGNQFTDVWLNEMDTLPEELFTGLADRVGRDPPFEVIQRHGRYFGDSNPPDVLNYVFRDFYENPKPGYRLYRQPGGRDAGAENVEVMGRGYWEHSAMVNAHKPWWVRVMVDARPGYLRANDPVYPTFDDTRNIAEHTLEVIPELPVIVSVDGGKTPAAAYSQEKSDGQLRVLAEVALTRGGMKELSVSMLALEQARFDGCTFHTVCDPAMDDGAELADENDRRRLEKYLGRPVKNGRTNNPDVRWEAVRDKLRHSVEGGPGFLLDPSCKGLRRGFNQTYAFRQIAGTNDRGDVQKTFDSHIHDALQYGAMECGTAAARRRTSEAKREREDRRENAQRAPRYNPNSYSAKRSRR